MSKRAISNILLLITAIIWGSAFVAQKAGTALEPFTYNGIRTFIGGIALLPVIAFMSGRKSADRASGQSRELSDNAPTGSKKDLIIGGILCGIILAFGSNLQQIGMDLGTDAGKAGFITALYIVLVPVIGILVGKKIRPIIWVCVLIGAVGFYFLTMAGRSTGFSLEMGDLILLLGAIAFACHILVIDHFSPKVDGVKLSCLQFFVAGGLTIILMFIFESPSLPAILECWFPILYAGVISAGIGYTLQIIAQKHAQPSEASLIMSLESVFAVITGAIILHERMSMMELIGCVVIFLAVILSQLPEKKGN